MTGFICRVMAYQAWLWIMFAGFFGVYLEIEVSVARLTRQESER